MVKIRLSALDLSPYTSFHIKWIRENTKNSEWLYDGGGKYLVGVIMEDEDFTAYKLKFGDVVRLFKD
jgi:hypothetical protein